MQPDTFPLQVISTKVSLTEMFVGYKIS